MQFSCRNGGKKEEGNCPDQEFLNGIYPLGVRVSFQFQELLNEIDKNILSSFKELVNLDDDKLPVLEDNYLDENKYIDVDNTGLKYIRRVKIQINSWI